MIDIDRDKCQRDGFCVQVCPVAIIRQPDKDSPPKMLKGKESGCLACGHCVSVCPQGALNHYRVPLERCQPIISENIINQNQVVQFLRSRRSVRRYKKQAVEPEKIRELIEIARYAPTGGNRQALTWTVITNRDLLKQAAGQTVEWMRTVLQQSNPEDVPAYLPGAVAAWDLGFDAILRDAPALIIASAPESVANGMVDLSVALAYLELAALPLGLGTCWAGMLQAALNASPSLRERVGLPEDHVHHYPMMLGYPRFRYHRLPERNPPRIVTFGEGEI